MAEVPVLFAINGSYKRFDPENLVWDTVGSSNGVRVRYFGDGLMYHLSVNGSTTQTNELLRSTDYGDTWTAIAPPTGYDRCTSFDVSASGRIVAIYSTGGAAASTFTVVDSVDQGETWDELLAIGSTLHRYGGVSIHPTDEDYVAFTDVSSTDDAAVWIATDGFTFVEHTLGLELQPSGTYSSNPRTVWAGGEDDDGNPVYRIILWAAHDNTGVANVFYADDSNDWASWTLNYTGTTSVIQVITRAGSDGPLYGIINAASGDCIIRSIDGGVTWEGFTATGAVAGHFTSLAVGASSDTIWVGDSNNPNVFQVTKAKTSSFEADDWVELPDPGTVPNFLALEIIDEGVFVPVPPGPDEPVGPPYGGFPGPGKSRIFDAPEFGLCDQPDDAQNDEGTDYSTSDINDSWIDGDSQIIISLVDRAPPGAYALVRSTTRSYSDIIQSAKAMGLRGLIFVLGDTENPPEHDYPGGPLTPKQYLSHALRWEPDPDGQPWQVHQYNLEADQLTEDPVGCEISGPQMARNAQLVVGGLFVCGQGAFERPAQAAAMMAATRNRLSLDFVMPDLDTYLPDGDPVWNQEFAAEKVQVMAGHLQQRFIRSPRSPTGIELSSHAPVFFVFPPSPFDGTTQLFNNLLNNPASPDGTTGNVDTRNTFGPFDSGYTGPMTFGCPRVLAGATTSDIVNAWQWMKPHRVLDFYYSLTQAAFMFDARDGGSVGSIPPVVVQFNNSSKNWTPEAGMLIIDDFDAAQSGVPSAPDSWWDFDGEDPILGAYVPAIHPDPPPIGIVGEEYEAWVDSRGRTISFEKAMELNGHELGPPPDPDAPPDQEDIPEYDTGDLSGVLTIEQAYNQALIAGFSSESAVIATAIMMAESGLDSSATGYNNSPACGCPSTIDRGIVQINDCCHPEVSDACAYNSVCAISAMYTISSGGTDFTPWSTYNGGNYLQYVGQVEAAAGGVTVADPNNPTPKAQKAQKKKLTLWFENWKIGWKANAEGTNPNSFVPGFFNLDGNIAVGDARRAIPSWIKVNGMWAIPKFGVSNGYRFSKQNFGRVVFSGKPLDGDEGVYMIDVAASQASWPNSSGVTTPIIISVTNPRVQEDEVTATTTIKTATPDQGARDGDESYLDGSQYHTHLPKVHNPVVPLGAQNRSFPDDVADGIAPVLPPLDLDPRGQGKVSLLKLCGGNYMEELLPAAYWYCMGQGVGRSDAGSCGRDLPFFETFVLLMARGISGFNPHYEGKGGCAHGLFGVDNCTGIGVGYTREELIDPAFNYMVVAEYLQDAVADVVTRCSIGGYACCSGRTTLSAGWGDTEKYEHAALAFLELTGLEPGDHFGDPSSVGFSGTSKALHTANPCYTTPSGPIAAQIFGSIAENWECYRDTVAAAGAPTPGRDGSSGQPGAPGGDGTPGGGSGGTPGVPPPDGAFLPGCPIKGVLTADCGWHWSVEGIPAIDIGCVDGAALRSTCDGVVVYRGPDGGGVNPGNGGVGGLGLEVRVLCDSGIVVRYGHQQVQNYYFVGTDSAGIDKYGTESFASNGCDRAFCPNGSPVVQVGINKCMCLSESMLYGKPICEDSECPSSGPCVCERTVCCGDDPNVNFLGSDPGSSNCVPCTGTRVSVGTRIGRCDNTGRSSGSHTHIEVWTNWSNPDKPTPPASSRICPLDVLPPNCP